jgi:BMFP domain-containing protein YqiC
MANDTKTRLDDVQKRLRGLDALEQRVARLEQRLAAQSKKPAARKASARKPAPKKPAKPS